MGMPIGSVAMSAHRTMPSVSVATRPCVTSTVGAAVHNAPGASVPSGKKREQKSMAHLANLENATRSGIIHNLVLSGRKPSVPMALHSV